jgi:cytochrome c oxidase subunit 4
VLDLLAPLILSPGVKGFFEDPRYLLGLPLAALGALGLLIALSPVELRWPQPVATTGHVAAGAEGHPGPTVYVTVGVILAVITMLEVGIYYIDMVQGALVTFLLLLSAMKFVLVVLWFMHLRFDNRLFSVLFTGGLLLVVALFVVVLTSLGASLT